MKKQSTEKTVLAWLRKFAKAYSCKDIAGAMALIETDRPVMVVGSGPDEKCFNVRQFKKQIQRDFAQADKIAMKFDWIKAAADENVAWFACELRLAVTLKRKKTMFPYRFTGVLARRGNELRLRMAQMGLIASSQETGESWPSPS